MAGQNLLSKILSGVVGIAIGAGAVWFYTAHSVKERSTADRKLALLQSENERLREFVAKEQRAKIAADSKVRREAIERSVEEIRGLKFKEPVDYNVLSRKEIKEVVSGKLDETVSAQEFEHISAAFARLGLLPEKYPLRQQYIELLGEQIAAFYDQHAHKLFMFEDASLENAQNRVVLAHELTHAMQDQHFGLKKLPLEIKNNDDRAIASSALVEGEATLVMSEFMLKNMSLATLKDTVASTFAQNMDQIQKAPRFLRDSLIFPYLRGQEFCSTLMSRGGYEEISRAYQKPPSSTAQILHPEKYLANPREEPVAIEWSVVELNGKAPTVDNVLGELGVRLLLASAIDDQAAVTAAEGWRGDRYLSFGLGDSFVWKSEWATETDAQEFFVAQAKVLGKRYGISDQPSGDQLQTDAPRALRLQRVGTRVFMVDAADPATAGTLAAQFGR